MIKISTHTRALRRLCHPTAERRSMLFAALCGLLSLVAYGCAPSEGDPAGATGVDDTGSVDVLDPNDRGPDGLEIPGPRLPAVASQRIDPDDCIHEMYWEYGSPMDLVTYVHAADDFVLGRIERIEPLVFPFQPDFRGEIPAEECEPDMVRPAFDLVLSDVWSARGSVEASVTIRLSGNTWSEWGAYPTLEDEPETAISWLFNPGVEVPPVVPGMWIGGAVYGHTDVASLWFNTVSEPLIEIVGDEVFVQRGTSRVNRCGAPDYRYLEDHAVTDAWDGLSVEAWQASVAQLLAEPPLESEVGMARLSALNPYGEPGLEVSLIHSRAYCVQRTLRNDWFCDDGRRPFICPLIDDEPCACECTSNCSIEGEICMPDNTCAAP